MVKNLPCKNLDLMLHFLWKLIGRAEKSSFFGLGLQRVTTLPRNFPLHDYSSSIMYQNCSFEFCTRLALQWVLRISEQGKYILKLKTSFMALKVSWLSTQCCSLKKDQREKCPSLKKNLSELTFQCTHSSVCLIISALNS